MRLPEWKPDTAKWDRWQAFHKDHGPLTQFETGEVVTTGWYFRDRYRLRFLRERFNISIIASDDFHYRFAKAKLTSPDGVEIKRSNLFVSQCFLYDHDTQALVRFDSLSSTDVRVPQRFRGKVTSYIAGPGSMPVGGVIRATKPGERDAEMKEGLSNLRALAKAWLKLDDEAKSSASHYVARRYDGLSANRAKAVGYDFEKLQVVEKRRIAECGFSGPFETLEFPYLKMEITE